MGGLLKKVVQEVQNRDRKNPKVKTADSSVFENILDKFKNRQQQADNPATSYAPSQEDFCDDLCNDLNEAQTSNSANPNVETADSSVYADMKAQIEALKAQMNAQATASSGGSTINPMPLPNLESVNSAPTSSAAGIMATTNSNGGSLSFRTAPDMGAPTHNVRIPEYSKLRVLGYSDNSINLDGITSRFAQVDYNGQTGWVLEAYLGID